MASGCAVKSRGTDVVDEEVADVLGLGTVLVAQYTQQISDLGRAGVASELLLEQCFRGPRLPELVEVVARRVEKLANSPYWCTLHSLEVHAFKSPVLAPIRPMLG